MNTIELLLRADLRGRYTADLRLSLPHGDVELATGAVFEVDMAQLLAASTDPVVYGRSLTGMLFAEPRLRDGWARAVGASEVAHDPLRVLLTLPAESGELHAIRWELLWDPLRDGFLCLNERLMSVRYLPSTMLPPMSGRGQLSWRALIAIANPTDLSDYGLEPTDVDATRALFTSIVGDMPTRVLAHTLGQTVSLGALRKALGERTPAALFLCAHAAAAQGDPRFFLEGDDGEAKIVPASDLRGLLRDLVQPPPLTVLVTGASGRYGEQVGSIGAQLVTSGAPAVLELGRSSLDLTRRFLGNTFRELQRDGDIIRAVATARASCRELSDWWRPILFTSIRSGQIWSLSELRPAPQQPRPAEPMSDEPLPVREPEPATAPAEAAATHGEEGAAAPPPTRPARVTLGSRRGAFNDAVSDVDLFEMGYTINAFADLIESSDTVPPLTIGIFGAWGQGKSFILTAMRRELERRQKQRDDLARKQGHQKVRGAAARAELSGPPAVGTVHIIEFNAWMYNANEKIWPSLVSNVMDHFEQNQGIKLPTRLRLRYRFLQRQIAGSLPRILVAVALIAMVLVFILLSTRFELSTTLALIGALGVGGLTKLIGDTLNEPLSKWLASLMEADEYGQEIGYMSATKADLKLLHDSLGKGSRTLIIIDDLDRCEPPKAVEVLQAINQLLNFPGFIVCIGIDARIVTHAIEKHYGGLLSAAGVSGYEYLDKIVQIPFLIPQRSPDQVKSFLARQMQPLELTFAPARPSDAPAAVSPGLPPSTSAPEEAVSQRPQLSPDELPLPDSNVEFVVASAFTGVEVAAFQQVADVLRPNPRHLKRLLNVYRLVRTLAQYVQDDEILGNPSATVGWLIICAQWPCLAHVMTWHLDQILENLNTTAEGLHYPAEPPLSSLLARAESSLAERQEWQDLRGRLDDDPADLRALISSLDTQVSWPALRRIRVYSINFNPVVEIELRLTEPGTKAAPRSKEQRRFARRGRA